MCQIAREVNADLTSEGLLDTLPTVPGPGALLFGGVGEDVDDGVLFFDDLCHCVVDREPAECRWRIIRVMAITLNKLCFHGLKPNFKKSKTAVSFCFRGRGAPLAKAAMFHVESLVIPIATRALGLVRVHVTQVYKHLGSMESPDGNHGPEAKYRAGESGKATGTILGPCKQRRLRIMQGV